MDKLQKFDLMAKIVRELEDLKNSQQAVIQKIAKIEIDNIELGDKKLEKDLPDVHQRTADNMDTISDILDYFAGKTDTYGDSNNVDKLREEQAIRDSQA